MSESGQQEKPCCCSAEPAISNPDFFWSSVVSVGFLTSGRSWALRVDNSKNTQIYNNLTVNGAATAASFTGDGSGLTNLNVPDQSIPVQVNGAGDGTKITAINFNLDRGSIDFTLSTGETFSAAFAR